MKGTSIISSKVFIKVTVIILAILICQSPAWAGQENITVMTRNLYIGAEIQSLAGAENEEEFIEGVMEALMQMAANNFPERAVALTAEIVKKRPHLVGLQEVYNITINGKNDTPPFRDYLNDLLDALEDQGASYYVAAVVNNLDLSIPVSGFGEFGVLDRDVILAREDVETQVVDLGFGGFCSPERLSEDGCNYQVVAEASTPIGPIAFERGFVAVDAWIGYFPLRFFNTHLEVRNPDPSNPLSPLVQRAQARELVVFLSLPRPHNGPVIVAGDINSSPEDSGAIMELEPPYVQLAANNHDAWTLRRWESEGFTCCYDEDLSFPADLYERIDVIFSSVLPRRVKANVVGNDDSDLTPSGLWPSDHAGVVANLYFTPFPRHKKHFKAKIRHRFSYWWHWWSDWTHWDRIK